MLAVLHLGGGSRQNKGRKSFSETGRVVPLVPQPLLGVVLWGLDVTLTLRAPSHGASAMEVDAVSSPHLLRDLLLQRLPAGTTVSPSLLPKGSRHCRAATRCRSLRLGHHLKGSGAQELPPPPSGYSRPMGNEGWIASLASAALRKHGRLGCLLGFPVRLTGSRAHAQRRGDRGLWLLMIRDLVSRRGWKAKGPSPRR